MAANRIRPHQSLARRPRAAQQPAVAIPNGFVLCPTQLATVAGWQQEIYRLAYERAKAAAEIPGHHRRLFCVWN
jgi:hypothetical protein